MARSSFHWPRIGRIKVWRPSDYSELKLWDNQPDVATALAFGRDGASFEVGRMDGSLASYAIPAAEPVATRGRRSLGAEPVAKPTSSPASDGVRARTEQRSRPGQPDHAARASHRHDRRRRAPGASDFDFYRFTARAGEQWVFEINAARSKSKLDSFLEILDGQRPARSAGASSRRCATRISRSAAKTTASPAIFASSTGTRCTSTITCMPTARSSSSGCFRGGPIPALSAIRATGSRWGYFDTTPLAHALGEPCYVVEPHPPGTKLVANGLPVFSLYYENDDDAHRELGKDSRLFFTAPADGEYLVKVKDVRGFQGPSSAIR